MAPRRPLAQNERWSKGGRRDCVAYRTAWVHETLDAAISACGELLVQSVGLGISYGEAKGSRVFFCGSGYRPSCGTAA